MERLKTRVLTALVACSVAFSASAQEPDQPATETAEISSAVSDEIAQEIASRPFPAEVYRGATVLKMDPAFVHDIREGLELLYLRDYGGAKTYFDGMSVKYPSSAVGPVGRALIWQALMMENFDFRYDAQYAQAFKRSIERLEVAKSVPGNEAWEHFLTAGILGVEAIHRLRKGNYVSALSQAFEAMRAVGRAREYAPDMPDLLLADGIYNYWRTVITEAAPYLPSFSDRREEGIEQMRLAEKTAVFLQAPSTLALTFSYMEERDYRSGLTSSLALHRTYPDNVVNNLVLARMYILNRMPRRAENVLKEVLEDAPDNQRAHYYLSVVYLRTGRTQKSLASIDRYLAFDLSDKLRASAMYRKGNVYMTRKDYDAAEGHYREAWKLARHKLSKGRLQRIKQLRQEATG